MKYYRTIIYRIDLDILCIFPSQHKMMPFYCLEFIRYAFPLIK